MNIFSTRLKELMQELNLNNTELQRKTGLSNQAISNWLNNKAEPSLSSLKVLAVFFNCSIDFLAGLKDE